MQGAVTGKRQEVIMGKWTLSIGCHNGTLMSRDSAQPSSHDTEEDALAEYIRQKDIWRSLGYYIWFARITNAGGEVVFHDNGIPYR